ncbi:MAG: endonuclease/exonuclease/phosphatase family protein [Syntrophorhabdales bacterium]
MEQEKREGKTLFMIRGNKVRLARLVRARRQTGTGAADGVGGLPAEGNGASGNGWTGNDATGHPAEDGSFRIVTYNVHRCRGLDGRTRPSRIVEVLAEVDADIVALQEVWNVEDRGLEDEQARFIAGELGLHYCFGENRRHRGGGYGNMVLSRLPLVERGNIDLSHPGREERGCLCTDVMAGDEVLHVYNVHLGTAYRERRHQGRRLVESESLAGKDVLGPRILVGDFNEWLRGLTSRLLTEHFGTTGIRQHLARRRTYPGPLPLVYLDNMYFDASLELEQARLHRTRKALIASDHLPLVADFRMRRGTNSV